MKKQYSLYIHNSQQNLNRKINIADKNLSIFFHLNRDMKGGFYIDGEPKIIDHNNEEVDIKLDNLNDNFSNIEILYDVVENSLDLDVDHAFILSGEGLGYEYVLELNNIESLRL